jgi:hypothetical protein
MSTSTSSKGQPVPQSLDVKSSDYAKGAEAATIYHELLKKCINRLSHSLFKSQMSSIVNTGANYKPAFKTIAEIKVQYDTSEQAHVDAMYAALSKITAADIAAMPSVITQCHAALVETFGKESKGVLRADIAYKRNDDAESPDPTITWAAFMRTHITEREGTGTLRKVLTKVNAIVAVLSISPSPEDNLVEYEERLIRRINGLKENHGFDVMKTIFNDESELALLYIFRLGPDYAPFQRDLENGIIPLPKTLHEAVVALKDRVEVSNKKHESVAPVSVFAAVTGEPRSDTRREAGFAAKRSPPAKKAVGFSKSEGVTTIKKRSPLDPYPYMNHSEFKELSEADRLHIRAHNGAIRDAIKEMDKGRTARPNPKEKVLVTTGGEVEEDEPIIVFMSAHQECMDLTYDDSERSIIEVDLTNEDAQGKDRNRITSRDRGEGEVHGEGVSLNRPTTPVRLTSSEGAGLALGGRRYPATTARNRPPTATPPSVYRDNPMEASLSRLIADHSLPTINPGGKEFFNLITLPINTKSGEVESSFWVVVGGEHSGDIVDSLDEATLRTTATTMALCGEHHPDGFAMGFETMELANNWHAKLYRSLRSNGWKYSTSMSARKIAGSCWVRYASSNPDPTKTAEADDEDWRKLPCVPLPPFAEHDPTDLGPYFPKDRLVPYSDSDSSAKSKQSAGSRKNLKRKEKRITKRKEAIEQTYADIGLPELVEDYGSESESDSDEDTSSKTSSGDTEHRATGRIRSLSDTDGPFTRGVETTNYDDMPQGVYSDDDDDDAGPTIRGAIRGAIRGVTTLTLSTDDERA